MSHLLITKEQIESLQHMQKYCMERLTTATPEKRLWLCSTFLRADVELIQEIKRYHRPNDCPTLIVHEIEKIATIILQEISFHRKHIDKNNTRLLDDVLGSVCTMINGVMVSDRIKEDVQRQSEANHWHGH